MKLVEKTSWPDFVWDQEKILKQLIQLRYNQGVFLGLGLKEQQESNLQMMTEEVVKTSQIKGHYGNKSI